MVKQVLLADVATTAACQIFGERISVLADHDQTGSYEVYVHDAPEGAGPPPHFHPWDEAFFVIDGAVDFECASMTKTVKAGGFVHVPAGTIHSFRYASTTARVLGFTSCGGAAAMFRAVDGDWSAVPDMDRVVAALNRNRVELAGRPG